MIFLHQGRFGRGIFALFLVLVVGASLWGQEPSLYGAGVAESAVLVRVVNAGASGPVSIQVGAQVLSASAVGDASAYKPVAADIYTLFYGGKRYEFVPEMKNYYTLVALPGALVTFRDERHDDPARAQLYFYNLEPDADAELRTADGRTRVVGPVPGTSSGQVAVNAVSVPMAVFRKGAKIGSDLPLDMVRGASYAVFLIDGSDGPQSFAVMARVETD